MILHSCPLAPGIMICFTTQMLLSSGLSIAADIGGGFSSPLPVLPQRLTRRASLMLGCFPIFILATALSLRPASPAGPYLRGRGKDLGHVFEIRSGLEIAYRFNNRSRLGLLFYHISNAGLGDDRNPGAEALSVCPSPLKLGHYFVPDRGDFDGSETTFRRGHSEAVA